jgi:integrase
LRFLWISFPWLPGGYPRLGVYNHPMRAKVTKRSVDAAQSSGKRLYVYDTELKGFGLLVTPKGHKSYFVEFRPGSGGRKAPKKRVTIGTHGSPWTPDGARKEADHLLRRVADNEDPSRDRSAARTAALVTFNAVADEYIQKYCMQNQKSWRETERVFRRDFRPRFGPIPIHEITKPEILELLDRTAAHAPIMANRQLAYIRKFFNWCIERGLLDTTPCYGLKAPAKPTSRDRVLDDSELAEMWRAVLNMDWPWGPFIQLLILTGQRRSEVAGIRWEELDLEAGIWSLPQERSKNRTAHVVPLTQSTLSVLHGIPMTGDFLFSTTGRTPISGFSKAKKMLDDHMFKARVQAYGQPKAQPLPHWTLHDIRRTVTTGMARLGTPPHIADAVINHRSGAISGVTAIYNRHKYLDECREALEHWNQHLATLL